MASEYDHLTGTTTYASYAARWLANVLGTNAWGISLIVGDGAVFPTCMQHQVANLAGSLDGSPPVLAGAAVEGPNSTTSRGLVSGMRTCPANGVDHYAQFNGSGATFQDNVQSWSTDEPAIDLMQLRLWPLPGRCNNEREEDDGAVPPLEAGHCSVKRRHLVLRGE